MVAQGGRVSTRANQSVSQTDNFNSRTALPWSDPERGIRQDTAAGARRHCLATRSGGKVTP